MNLLKQAKNIFIVGIKGVAMANLALIFKKMGKMVSGCDVKEEFITDDLLKKNRISWQKGFNQLPDNIDLIIYSAAHGGVNNPLIDQAKKKGIKSISQAQVLGYLMSDFETKIAVCGSHGKTTTASLLVYSLIQLDKKPSYLVGTPKFNDFWGGDYQKSEFFVAEADEYATSPPAVKTPKFHFLTPDFIIATNIDFDHPDVYKDINHTRKAFFKFFANRKLILNIDDPSLVEATKTLKCLKLITYGFSKEAQYQIVNWKTNEDGTEFSLKKNDYVKDCQDFLKATWKKNHRTEEIAAFKISLFGQHNIANATAVVILLFQLGFGEEEIRNAIISFTGAKRRFEKIYSRGIFLFDDYAHHPREIMATIEAARKRFPRRRIIVIFQPHTYSRTMSLLQDFANSLSYADQAFILPIFSSAREKKENFSVSSSDIGELNPNKLILVSSKANLIKQLSSFLQQGDVIFTMGAGDVYKLKNDIIKLIANVKS